MRPSRLACALSVGALSFAIAGCTASLELDRFRSATSLEEQEAVGALAYFDVKYSATSMESHLNEYFEMRVVNASHVVQAKAIYNDIVLPNFTLFLGKIVPKGNGYRLDFWADHNFSGKYDGIVGGINDKDHAWRRVLGDPPSHEDIKLVGSTWQFDFLHNTNFDDIFTDPNTGAPIPNAGEDTLLPFELTVLGTPAYLGKTMEIRVEEAKSGRMVGFYRQGRLKETFVAKITSILDEVTTYTVSAYVDMNANEAFDQGDPSWKLDLTTNEAGGLVTLDTAAPETPIDAGAPAP